MWTILSSVHRPNRRIISLVHLSVLQTFSILSRLWENRLPIWFESNRRQTDRKESTKLWTRSSKRWSILNKFLWFFLQIEWNVKNDNDDSPLNQIEKCTSISFSFWHTRTSRAMSFDGISRLFVASNPQLSWQPSKKNRPFLRLSRSLFLNSFSSSKQILFVILLIFNSCFSIDKHLKMTE